MSISAPQMTVVTALVVSTGAAAAVDLAHRRIPNGLSFSTAAVGVILAATGVTGITLWSSVAGFAIGLALMMPGHVLGATGAGDVKLFAATGTLLGAAQTFEAFLYVAIAGGVLALAIAFARGRLARTVTQTAALVGQRSSAQEAIESPVENNRFAYGPAIAVGCLIAAMW